MYAMNRAARNWSYSSTEILSLLQSLGAIAVFLLFLLRRSERENLWFSLFLAVSAAQGWALLSEGLQVSPFLLINGVIYCPPFPSAGVAHLAFYRQLPNPRRSPLYLASLVCLF